MNDLCRSDSSFSTYELHLISVFLSDRVLFPTTATRQRQEQYDYSRPFQFLHVNPVIHP